MDAFPDFKRYADQLAEVARWAARKGWAPATSTNYSVRLPDQAAPAICAITASGVDKEHLVLDDVVAIDRTGRPVNRHHLKPSAETLLHLMLYHRRNIGAVLHTHSVAGTLLSRQAEPVGYLTFSGWELLKGLDGIDRHDSEVRLPIFPDSQDIAGLAAHIEPRLPSAGPCRSACSSSTPPREISPTCFLICSTRAWEQRVKPLPITGSLAAWVSGPRAFSSYRMLRWNWRRQPRQACGPFTWCDPELIRELVARSVRRSMIFPRQDQLRAP